jgi:hypothetical protein
MQSGETGHIVASRTPHVQPCGFPRADSYHSCCLKNCKKFLVNVRSSLLCSGSAYREKWGGCAMVQPVVHQTRATGFPHAVVCIRIQTGPSMHACKNAPHTSAHFPRSVTEK